MEIFRMNPRKPLLMLFIGLIGIVFVVAVKKPPYRIIEMIALIIGGIGLIGGTYISLAYAIKVDSTGITNIYILSSKFTRIRKHIKWSDIAEITINAAKMPVIIPKITTSQKCLKFKDIIIISNNMENYIELTRLAISNATNAIINENVKQLIK